MTVADRLESAAELPAMSAIVDLDVMSARLVPLLAQMDTTSDAADVSLSAAAVVGGKTGERAVIAYDTQLGDDRGPVLIGKAFADGVRARRLYDLLVDLSRAGLGDDNRSPYPLACLPEFGMVVYVAAAGRPLDQVEHSERTPCAERAGRWLATLHSSGLDLPRRFDLPNEMVNVALWLDLVARARPSASGAAAQLLAHIRSLADRVRLSNEASIHKDFHYQHTLFTERSVTVIDLDEARTGDPAFDVAHFVAYLRLLSLRDATPAEDSHRLEAAFLNSYSSRTGYDVDDRHALAHAYTCAKIAKQLMTGRGPTPVPSGIEAGRQVDRMLREGLRWPGR